VTAEGILREHRDKLKLLADTLLVKENLDDDEIRSLLGFPARHREHDNGAVAGPVAGPAAGGTPQGT
jgi:hypothetical protein